MNNQFKIWPVLRDVIIVQGLTMLGGFIHGFVQGYERSRHGLNPSHSNSFYDDVLYLIVGFTFSACLATGNRWRHLVFVAVTVWTVDIFAVLFFGVTLSQWLAQAVGIAICMGIGGGVSYLFKRKTKKDGKLDQTPDQCSTSRDKFSNAGDDKFYEEVARELQEKSMLPGLWTRAFAEMGGDEAKTRALYIKYRVASMKEERKVFIKRNQEDELNDRIKLEKEELEHQTERSLDGEMMLSQLMTICKKCGYAGSMNKALIPPPDHFLLAPACKCPKCSNRFDWYYVPSKDLKK